MTVKQVWQASDGSVHDTEEAAMKADARRSKYAVLERMYNESPLGQIEFLITKWDTIKKVMEGDG